MISSWAGPEIVQGEEGQPSLRLWERRSEPQMVLACGQRSEDFGSLPRSPNRVNPWTLLRSWAPGPNTCDLSGLTAGDDKGLTRPARRGKLPSHCSPGAQPVHGGL